MTYLIRGLSHDLSRQSMAVHSFSIDLSPQWREEVAASGIEQKHVDAWIESCGRRWLDCAGYSHKYDPDNYGHLADKSKPPGPNAKYIHEPRTALRVTWGEWGPEHMTVPGSACGLDIDRNSVGSVFECGKLLNPHNVDSMSQKYLLLMMFTFFAECVYMRIFEDDSK